MGTRRTRERWHECTIASWFPNCYPGTSTKKAGEMAGEIFHRGGRSASFYVRLSRSPMHALEVTGNLSKEESRDGRSGNYRGLDLSPKEPWINGTSRVRPWFRGTGKKS
jgi:hypothetical protein